MKLNPGVKVKKRNWHKKRTQLEIRLDDIGLSAILATYTKNRKWQTEKEAERAATGAGTDVCRRLWRKRARQGEEPFYTVFSKIDEVEAAAAEEKVPALFEEIEKRDPYKAYGLLFPLQKYRRHEEARKIAVDESHAEVVRQLVEGLSDYFDKVLDKKTARAANEAMSAYVQAFEGDLTDARTAGKGEGDEGEESGEEGEDE